MFACCEDEAPREDEDDRRANGGRQVRRNTLDPDLRQDRCCGGGHRREEREHPPRHELRSEGLPAVAHQEYAAS